MTDNTLKQAVLDELKWEPSVNEAHIGVTARDGVVALTGDVDSYSEKLAAERAAGRVLGVKGVAQDLKVRYPFDNKVDDADIARKAIQSLEWNIEVPPNKVKVKVEDGWVTLSGTLDWYFQHGAAAAAVRNLKGVRGVINSITIKPTARSSDVRDKIMAALKRNAQIEADKITVTTDEGKVTLSGRVDSWGEDSLVVETAWSAPGVSVVIDNLVIA